MSEPVIITPAPGRDLKGNPVAPVGEPFTVLGLVAPGNTARTYVEGGDLEEIAYTIYFTARVRQHNEATDEWSWQRIADLLPENFTATLRGSVCPARVQVWDEGGRGGVVVLASAATGKA